MNVPRLLLSTLLLILAACTLKAQEKIAFDLKTKYAEKLELAPAKNGAAVILLASEWGTVRELGEDYALWLRNIHRERSGDSVRVTLDLELRSGTLFDEGELLRSRRVEVVYGIGDDWRRLGSQAAVRLVTRAEACAEIAATTAEFFYPAATKLASRLIEAAELMMPGDYGEMKLEAMAVGMPVAEAARSMAEEIRQEGESRQ